MSDLGDVALTTILTTLIIADIVGNFLVIFVIKRNRDMRYAECGVPVVYFQLLRTDTILSRFMAVSYRLMYASVLSRLCICEFRFS